MRTPKLDWEALKPLLLNLREEQRMSLTDVNKYLFDNYGKCVTNARLSQIFSKWRDEKEAAINEGTL